MQNTYIDRDTKRYPPRFPAYLMGSDLPIARYPVPCLGCSELTRRDSGECEPCSSVTFAETKPHPAPRG